MIRTPVRHCLVLALAGSLALAGCGGDDKKAAEPKPSTSASPSPGTPTATPTPSRPEVEAPPVPAYAKGDAGKEAFARFVVDAWAYALATNDPSPLTEVSVGGKPCSGCDALTQTLDKRTQEGWSVFPFEVDVTDVRLIESDLGTTARVRLNIPENKSFFDDGSYRNTSPAHPDTVFTLSLRQVKKAYRLVGFTIS